MVLHKRCALCDSTSKGVPVYRTLHGPRRTPTCRDTIHDTPRQTRRGPAHSSLFGFVLYCHIRNIQHISNTPHFQHWSNNSFSWLFFLTVHVANHTPGQFKKVHQTEADTQSTGTYSQGAFTWDQRLNSIISIIIWLKFQVDDVT